MVSWWLAPASITIPLPPLTSVNGGFAALTLAISGPVPVLLMVITADAVAFGNACRVSLVGFTEMRPPPGVAVAVGVGVRVAVAVAVAVGVPVGVTVAVGVVVPVEVEVLVAV